MTHTPYREAGLDREAVARIIYDMHHPHGTRYDDWAAHLEKHPESFDGRNKSREIADAIIALASPTSEDAGEVEITERQGAALHKAMLASMDTQPQAPASDRAMVLEEAALDKLRDQLKGALNTHGQQVLRFNGVPAFALPHPGPAADAILAAIRQLASSPPEVADAD